MLKLKRVQILGFKSFCDKTEVQLTGNGIIAVVGPNGCGKSNISDAITWVLGEQSAKSLRGVKMEDVIFAGTRDRKPTGMAEVSLTLVDPDVYDGAVSEGEPEIVVKDELSSDWDENAFRAQRAAETEAAVAEAQPGVVLNEEEAAAAEAAGEAEQTEGENGVVLKIRRRKFNRAPVRAGEITITRRLFRSGDSEYLLNGKICRLRDIQDIFMGTGLSGENYAIIGQERIGQLLSSKPLDRRSIIEEAAGITRFKTKKRLAELRLEAARQNLARVDDIFEEVTRQMASLKRQAAKAERYGALRDELRAKLRVVLASRMAQMDADQAETSRVIAELNVKIEAQSADVETMDAEHTSGVQRGYGLDEEIREANLRANQAAVELERMAARQAANTDRIADLTHRIAGGQEELAQIRQQIESLSAESDGLKLFLETATAETAAARETAQQKQAEAQESVRAVNAAEQQSEEGRRQTMQLLQRASQLRNEEAQAAESLAGLDRESQRLAMESEQARHELEALGKQRGQVALSFESVTDRLQRLEQEIAELRIELETKRAEEQTSRRKGDQLRAEMATLMGRKSSLESLLRDHSYSNDTVKKIFHANQQGSSVAPVGTLADFLEVEDKYEAVVDEFLRDELNYIVVKSWDAAEEGMRMLKGDMDGRATFLVHPNDAQARFPFSEGMAGSMSQPTSGVTPLKNCIKVLDGFGKSLEVILPKLREGYVTPDTDIARNLALSNPDAFFLSPSGETFHNVTVTGGKQRSEGPLALKRELREVQEKLDAVEVELSQTDVQSARLAQEIQEAQHALEAKNSERREAERESANSGAALKQMESESARIERRMQDWALASERNRDARAGKEEIIARKQEEAARVDAERAEVEERISGIQAQVGELRLRREELQQAAAAASASLAGLEERRRNASANVEQNTRLINGQQQRLLQVEQQLAAAATEQQRREEENVNLAAQHEELLATRSQTVEEAAKLTAEATELRTKLNELNQKLRTLRTETDALREQRSELTAKAARLASEIEHLEAASLNDLGMPAEELRTDESIVKIEAEALNEADEETRQMKQKLEAMGPVNMMALEEFAEAEQRHSFLETQRKDLLDSIDNTVQSIKEIDEISHTKFNEAFEVINENFAETFTKLFGGGQAMMKLTDEANIAESGIDIVASPPGKKLQNVLLLSGGEKALTALSLLVGIFQFQPSPFCVLDEVDAPLDETNVARFAKLVHEMSGSTQFIIITHHKRTMSEADTIYGVTMQEPGVSKIVSVNLNRAESRRVA
ncbi:MAG: chromosome segregation protein SMC [Acidobacteria bacterium]|nr:chromosome segregation protein SMC [Acidobacteriota bacterium]